MSGQRRRLLAYLGGGVGIDSYATQTFIPLFASYRGDLVRRGTVIPDYFVDGGYGLNTTRNDNPNREFFGGFLFCSGVGIKAIFGNNTGFLISVGYGLQQSAIEETGVAGTDRQELNYNRLALRAGFTF